MLCPHCRMPITLSRIAQDMGKKGGRASGVTKRRGDAEYYARIGRLGAAARKAKGEK